MKKNQYLSKLRAELIKTGLKKTEIDGATQYYSELIDESVETGGIEEDVIDRLPPPRIAAQDIVGNDTKSKESGNKSASYINKRRKSVTERVLLFILFILILLPILLVIVSVVFSVLAAFLSVIISLLVCGIALPIYAVIVAIIGSSTMVLFVYLSVGLFCLSGGLVLLKTVTPIIKLIKTVIVKSYKILANYLA